MWELLLLAGAAYLAGWVYRAGKREGSRKGYAVGRWRRR
jgi:hypothetical protein